VTGAVCPFCTISEDETFYLSPSVLATWDQFPVSPGHALIIRRRHCETWFDANPWNKPRSWRQLQWSDNWLLRSSIHDFNIGMNVGTAAGQTIPHLHLHLIPRYRGDVANPTGGVRSVILGKPIT